MFASIFSIFKSDQSNAQRKRSNHIGYEQFECKRMLAFVAPPATTTNIDTFLETTENAIVRVDEAESRLVIRLDGAENYVEVNLDYGHLQINPVATGIGTGVGPRLAIQPELYDQILIMGNGDDQLRVIGNDLRAQLHPDRTWVTTRGVGVFGNEGGVVSIHGTDLEDVSIEDNPLIDFGPYVFSSCLLYTSPSPRDATLSRMPSSA